MKLSELNIGGALLFLAAMQLFFMILIAEMLYPNYSVANDWISDLGVGSTALIFNGSVIFFGLLVLISAYFVQKGTRDLVYQLLQVIVGAGAVGVGLFPESTGVVHLSFAFVAFFFGAIAAILSARVTKGLVSYFSVILGVVSLSALFVGSGLGIDFGLGKGGMEKLVFYPILLWAIAFGDYLMNQNNPNKL